MDTVADAESVAESVVEANAEAEAMSDAEVNIVGDAESDAASVAEANAVSLAVVGINAEPEAVAGSQGWWWRANPRSDRSWHSPSRTTRPRKGNLRNRLLL